MQSFPFRSRTAILAVAMGLLAGCASTPPPPTAELGSAQQAISNAEQARASQDAPLELTRAREKLHAANNAASNEDMESAERLARESRVLAELAAAKAEMVGARRVNEEIVKATEMLEEEMRRGRSAGGSS